MFYAFAVLCALQKLGGGVGLSAIHDSLLHEGMGMSRYMVRKVLKELVSVGAIARKKNVYELRLFGYNLAMADIMTATGYAIQPNNAVMQEYQIGDFRNE